MPRKILIPLFLTGLLVLLPSLSLTATTQAATSITVTSNVQETPFVSNGQCTLAEAITAANTGVTVDSCIVGLGGGPYTIDLAAPGSYTLTAGPYTVDGANGLPSITADITINGNGAVIERNQVAPKFRIFHVSSTGKLTLKTVTIQGGYSDGGAGIYNGRGGTVRVVDSIIQNNDTETGVGGGIVNGPGHLLLQDSVVQNNIGGQGGGISSWTISSSVTINNSTIVSNTASAEGGGIFNNNGAVTVISSTIVSNTSLYRWGGGIFNGTALDLPSSLVIIDSTITGNTATAGGAIMTYGVSATLAITTSHILSNTVTQIGGGGGILIVGGIADLESNTIEANDTGISVWSDPGFTSTVLAARNVISGNTVAGIVFTSTDTVSATLSGSPSQANTFRANGLVGSQNILVTTPYSNPPINALWNDWGVSTLAEIEDTIWHQADDPALALVRYNLVIARVYLPVIVAKRK